MFCCKLHKHFLPGDEVTYLITELGFRVGFSSWIFELGFFGGIFSRVSNKFSVVLHNVLCQRRCTSRSQDGRERG